MNIVELFNVIAPRYDMTNYILSFGMDIGWRKRLLCYLPSCGGLHVLDLATGTADVAIILAKDSRVASVVGVDPAEAMLAVGRRKIAAAGLASKIGLLSGDALALDLPDDRYDVLTVAFGLRNFPDLMKGLMEAYRVIRPSGRLIVLEFSSPRSGLQKYVHGFYLNFIVPLAGMFMTGKKEAYVHLARTARVFPCGERFSRIMAQVGFEDVERCELFLGAATIYAGHKGGRG